jgi:tryptophanyl-tRNA synthetase
MKDTIVEQYTARLNELGIEHKTLEHPQLISVEAVQKYLGYGMEDSAATLLMKADDTFVAIIRRGDTKLDNAKVKKYLGITTLRMATAEEFEKITGVPSGAASVYITNVPTYIDGKIFEKEFINAGSGSLLVTIRYKTADLKKIPGVSVVDFTVTSTTSKKIADLKKNKQTIRALENSTLKYELIKHPPIKTVEEGLVYLGISADQGVSTLIFETEKGNVAVLRRDDHQLSEEKIKKVLGLQKIRMCKPSEVLKLTGCEVGFVSPYNPDFIIVMDKTILEKDFVYLGTGSPEYDLKIAPRDLVTFTKAKPADVVQKGVVRIKRRVVSGITPSGDGTLHIGNYLGAVKQFINIAKSFECYLFVADMHGLTTIQDKQHLACNIEGLVLNELALLRGYLSKDEFDGIVFYRQSDIAMHGELQSIINNVTPLGLLKRAHAYKDKLQKDITEDEINLGLFNYPILMAADILLYHPDFVPVGKDQKQHVEITRDIADRFNKIYKKKVFTLPEPMIPEDVGAVLGTDGKRKMSKSLGNIISIFDSEDVIKKQVMGTYTDPTRKHASDPGHIEGNMVFTYLDFFGDENKVDELKKRYREGSVGDVEVKEYLFESLMSYFAPARKAYAELKNNPKLVQEILQQGRDKALAVAGETMKEVRDAVGLNTQYSISSQLTVHSSQKKYIDSGSGAGMTISIDDFAKMEVRVGKVIEARNKEGSEKLIRLVVDFGTAFAGSSGESKRIIFTGVRGFGCTPEDFLGKQFFFITNLAPRKMMDEESQGMILAVDNADKSKPLFISGEGMPVGAKIR